MLKTVIPVMAAAALAVQMLPASAQIAFSDPVPEFEEFARTLEVEVSPIEATNDNDVGQSLINGTPVNPREFPGVLRMTTGGTCTAAIVGPATILFAAHCLQGNTSIRFVNGSGDAVRGVCTIAPVYNLNTHANDWALCLLQRRVTGIAFETIDTGTKPEAGERLMLTGYGCTLPGGSSDGILRAGFSDVVAQPSNFAREPSAIFIRSSVGEGDALLCPGDSGGPLFRSGDDTSAARQIVGVNSRVSFQTGVSIFSATASPAGAQFIRAWAEATNQEICGVNREIGCK